MRMENQVQEKRLMNQQAEQALLGTILLDNSLMEQCRLRPGQFAVEVHRNLFYVMRKLDNEGKPIDPVTILEVVKKEKLDKVGGMFYITELLSNSIVSSSFSHYQDIVEDYSQRRMVAEIAQNTLLRLETHSGQDLLQCALSDLNALDAVEGSGGDGHIRDALMTTFEKFEVDHGVVTGIPTGYRDLDAILSGFQPGDFVVIGARPSVGKTAFALNIADNAAEAGDVVGLFSLEMSEEQLIKRFISSSGHIDGTKMKNPRRSFQHEDWEKTTIAISRLSDKPIHIFDDPAITVGEIRRKCRQLRRQYKNRRILIMIDYLQLIQGDSKHRGNRQAEVAEISRALKVIARKLDVTIVALSQLSRGVEQRQDKRPMLSDLRETGQIEQDADIIAFLYRDDYYNADSEKKNIIEIIIAKQRNGPIGTVELVFLKNYNKFVSLDQSHQNNQPPDQKQPVPLSRIPDMYRRGK